MYDSGVLEMEIEGKRVCMPMHYLDLVTYVPPQAKGNAGYKNCRLGVIIDCDAFGVRVLYSKTRTVQLTNPKDLVWG
jgi:hypothetical protein